MKVSLIDKQAMLSDFLPHISKVKMILLIHSGKYYIQNDYTGGVFREGIGDLPMNNLIRFK